MMRGLAAARLLACLLSAAALLSGCGSMKDMMFPQGVKLDWESVSMYADPAANRDFPVAVDLVLVSDEALAQRLASMKSQEWFDARDGLRKAYPGGVEFDSVELVPGESMSLPGKRYSGKRVLLALVFADYFSAGDHRARVETLKGKISMAFGATDFSVSASDK